MVRFSTRFIAVLVTSLALLSTLLAPASAKTNGTTCHYEYNATAGNFLVSQYRGTTLTKTYATDRPPGNCTPVPVVSVPAGSLSIELGPEVDSSTGNMTVSGSGLEAYSGITVDIHYLDGRDALLGLALRGADSNGDVSIRGIYDCGTLASMTVYGVGHDGSPVTDTATAGC